MLNQLLTTEVYAFFLVFCRIGAFLSTMPLFNGAFTSARFRLLIALALTALIAPVLQPYLPPQPDEIPVLFMLIVTEILYGIFLGLLIAILFSVAASAGTMISFVTGLANAQLFNPLLSSSGALHGSILTAFMYLFLFATGTHALLFIAIVDSYTLMPPGYSLPLNDMAKSMTTVFASSFGVAFQIAAPFIVIIGLINVGMGILSRLMPQIPIFFVIQPVQIAIGIGLFLLILPEIMVIIIDHITSNLSFYSLLN